MTNWPGTSAMTTRPPCVECRYFSTAGMEIGTWECVAPSRQCDHGDGFAPDGDEL